ncbi:RNA-directed DNA polymerase, eukaryota, reverse transcriptase zinc-binding domain protein [Tanacetum coccineum]
MKYGRLVDSFIANKRSKRGKHFGFIRFLGIKDDTEFVKLLSNIWIRSYHLYVTVVRYQRTNSTGSKSTKQVLTKEENLKTKPNPNSQFAEYAPSKPPFASVIHNKHTKIDTITSYVNTKTVTLKDQDLISVEDSSMVLLLKLKDVDTMSNICKSEGFMDLKIHHVWGLWIWIQFPSSSSCSKFQDNVTLKSLYTILKYASPSFKVDERMVWIEISGLPLCAWGSNSFKKVARMFGKFMFFEAEESTAMSSGRVCISTRSHYRISEKVYVEIHGDLFDVQVHELGHWNNLVGDCFMINIYAPQELSAKSSLWNKIADFMHQHNGKFILFGDMNVVRHENERFSSIFSSLDADHYNTFIDSSGLILPIGGRLFTWMNKAGTKLSKLDRFLITEDVLDSTLDIRITALDRLWSDHTPILLHVLKSNFGPTPFKFYNSWLLRDDFDDIVKSAWSNLETNNDGRILMSHEKLRSLKSTIKQWQVNVRINDRSQKQKAMLDLKSIDKKIDDGTVTQFGRDNHTKLLQDIDKFDNLEAHDLIQKAHIKWDIEGDENSKFFHGVINQKRRTQAITGLCTRDRDSLETSVSCDEIKSAIWDCGSNKAPGPDVIDKIVSNEQSAFILGRQILDGLLILSEKYLDFVLISLGFGSKWRTWIRACLNSSRASILINGSPTSEFSIKRGLRQGDPLSSFLFILVMEGLHCAISNAVNSGLIRGVKIGSSDIILSHLFYADDVVITTEWNARDLDNIIRVLHVFYLASGLKINIHKSNIYGIGVSNEEVSIMATSTGCAPGSLPFTYLGLPIGSNMNLISNWQPLIDRFQSRLSSWKANMLSIGGRLTLIKAVLGSLGGLNIGSLKAFNLALLQKWRWRMHSCPNAFWVKIIKALHGKEGGFDVQGCNFNGTWSRIIGSSNYLHSKGIIPLNSLHFRMGCGTRIRFWKDIWIGDSPLHIRYNRLYRLDQDKDCLIIDRIENGQWKWNWSRTNIGVRNMAYLRDLLTEISLIDINVDEDSCVWSIAKDDIFTVGETRRIIDSMLLPSLVPPTSWYKVLPRKVNIFLWRLYLDRLPHRLNLSSRGMDIQSISCPMCNGNVESSSHIFFECDIASEVWRMVRNWCDIPLPSFSSHDQMRSWLCSWQVSKEKNHRVTVIFASLCWWLWRYRNNVTFCAHPMRKSDLFDNIRSSSYNWLSHRGRLTSNWFGELEVGELEVGELVGVLFGDLVGELLGELVGELV